jgi:hypothetical protein
VLESFEQLIHTGADTLRRRGRPSAARPSGQVREVLALSVVETQRLGERTEDLGGNIAGPTLFEPRVVLRAHTGQPGDLVASQARYAPLAAVRTEPGIVRPQPRPARSQELAQSRAVSHSSILPW